MDFILKMMEFVLTTMDLQDSMSNAELKQTLQDPAVKSIILGEIDEILSRNTRLSVVVKSQWNKNNLKWHYVMDDNFDYEPGPEKSVTALAEASGHTIYEVMYDTMCMNDGNGMTWRPLESYGGGDLETMREWLETEGVVPGISDAGAHLSIFQDGVAPVFFLTHWSRDRTRGPKMTCVWSNLDIDFHHNSARPHVH